MTSPARSPRPDIQEVHLRVTRAALPALQPEACGRHKEGVRKQPLPCSQWERNVLGQRAGLGGGPAPAALGPLPSSLQTSRAAAGQLVLGPYPTTGRTTDTKAH